MARQVLGDASPGFTQTVPEGLRESVQALVVLTDPKAEIGRAMLDHAREEGWAAAISRSAASLAATTQGRTSLAHKAQGYGMGPLDGLLYRGELSPEEYWTGATMLALWRDTQQEPLPCAQTLRAYGQPVAFGGSYMSWEDVTTLDLSVPAQRDEALKAGYCCFLSRTRRLHAESLATAATQWRRSPERFAYFVKMNVQGTWPAFALVNYRSVITPYVLGKADGTGTRRLPVFSLGVFTHDLRAFCEEPLAPVPRVGVDSVRALQEQVLADTRAVGVSHGFPWNDRYRKTHADFLPTGEAGFGWHDLGHLSVGSFAPPQARRDLVRLHRVLTEHGKTLDVPLCIGRFPLRKLFMARLFGLTDQSSGLSDIPVQDQVERYARMVVGQPLAELLVSENAARVASVQSTFLSQLPPRHTYYTSSVSAELREAAAGHWDHTVLIDDDLPRLSEAWERLANLQVAATNRWLKQHGYPGQVPPVPTERIVGLSTPVPTDRALPTESINLSGSVGVLRASSRQFDTFLNSPVRFEIDWYSESLKTDFYRYVKTGPE